MRRYPVARCVAVAAMATLALAACGPTSESGSGVGSGKGHGTIGVSFDLLNAVRTSEKSAIERAAASAGYKVVFDVADQDAQKQASQIQDLIQTRRVDALIVIAQDGKQIASSISLAKARHVPFVTIDRAVADEQDVSFQITGDPHADGELAADEFIAAARTKPLKVLELVGALTDQNAIGRRDGFGNTLKGHADLTVVSQVPTDWDPSQALDGTSNALQKNPGINAIFVPSDFLLPSVQSALSTAKRLAPVGDTKHVFLVTIDGDQNGCKAIRGKTLDADIATRVDQFGTEAVQAITTTLAAEVVVPKTVRSAGVTLDQANFATVKARVWGCGD
ncbi:monosaccharide ABC transporter substrate-binding protein, CUT2 family [Actinacidiphila yanglinensis]|uniref:Monosaccharide ABC transporter substrate-binding protein, CUT2 family n=1 Tax=Actinacidiphila yanglinensis TaxID=310779 RepID=A0A1H6EDD0_9ACTN|nr:sugar ABC transporter substrate-binding protein [Actinacidiphila yanglinensis]SEG94966.1 monosaccharide ABC transporter substrate-binding protein, CUT2 family [Actinacidiphila yanglinensis]